MAIKNVVIALLLFFAVAGCSPDPAKEGVPTRILSLSTAATHILFELGTPPVAIDEYGRDAAGEPAPEVIGKGSAVSLEKIAELEVDCAVVWFYQKEAAERFRNAGLRVEVVEPLRLKDHAALIIRLGELVGEEEKARELALNFERELAAIVPKTGATRRVYFELYSAGKAAGAASYIGDLLRAAGGESVIPASRIASAEHLAEIAPEVIFFVEGFGNAEELAARPGLATSPAVKHNRIYPVPRRLIVEGLAPLEAIGFLKEKIE